MILVSLSRSHGYLTWVVYNYGKVAKRKTVPVEGTRFDLGLMAESLTEALKVTKNLFKANLAKADWEDKITLEMSSQHLFKWLTERRFKDSHASLALPCIEMFNELPLELDIQLHSQSGKLWADKYNKEGLVTEEVTTLSRGINFINQFD